MRSKWDKVFKNGLSKIFGRQPLNCFLFDKFVFTKKYSAISKSPFFQT